ncbi:hypothetical protein A2121_01625 [Candidatus Nomurabacteria bacterium GWB1_40_6]|uniref:Uncharacterized protein n=1 Tax=Candidatus Nomurabacteria bacterium GWB1_40_6 TaxID=1801727 RepID=A0A1F6TMF9_9BACT|nr:MAG: hypothetical protein A2121_01625 [Candidatus Nomurabacteria bacterium GWB1_40_6]
MGNRRLYGEKVFEVNQIDKYDDVWHLIGFFRDGSIKSEYRMERRVRVNPDFRWDGVKAISFKENHVYECESIGRVTRRHMYGTGNWYVSPYCREGRWKARGKFAFEEFTVINGNDGNIIALEDGKLCSCKYHPFMTHRCLACGFEGCYSCLYSHVDQMGASHTYRRFQFVDGQGKITFKV